MFVRLADSRLTGLAHITELADGFVTDVEDAYPVGQGAHLFSIACRLGRFHQYSCRTCPSSEVLHNVISLLCGVTSRPVRKQRCRHDMQRAIMQPSVRVSAEVRAKVLRVDTEAGKLSLGLKPSYFEKEGDDDGIDAAESEDDDEDGRDLDEILAEELDAQQQHAAAQVGDSRCLPCTSAYVEPVIQ